MEIKDIANELLQRTYDYCVAYPQSQINEITDLISSTTQELKRAKKPRDIASLSQTLKTLHDIHDSLHQKSIIAFQASYKPLSNLIESAKVAMEVIEESSGDEPISFSESVDDEVIQIDIEHVYRKYED